MAEPPTPSNGRNFNITQQGTRKGRGRRKPSFSPVYYFSKQSSQQRRIRTNDLPQEPNHVGIYSPWAFVWGCVFAIVPVAYIYILLILLREVCLYFPEVALLLQHYLPPLSSVIRIMHQSSAFVEAWCILEAIFYVGLKLHILYLNTRDPLEASLRSAPFLKPEERQVLWDRMMDAEKEDPAGLISGWFFDQDIHKISRYDVREFVTWSMFEGRNQEHLTGDELKQLEQFVQQLEYGISVHWYGVLEEEENEEQNDTHTTTEPPRTQQKQLRQQQTVKPTPRKMFRFPELEQSAPPNFFSNLYESYRRSYDRYRALMETSDFHPVEDFWNFMATTTQQIIEAEETAMATATQTAENAMATATVTAESAMATATQTAENAMVTATQTATQVYETIVQPGSNVERRLNAIGQATHTQLIHIFNSVNSVKQGMKERLETAKFLATRRRVLRQQLKGYREMLHRLREMSSEVPSQQMAALMRRITECNQALERLESRAREAFDKATGYARNNIKFPSQQEPQPYAKYSSDPLLGVATYPLGFHMLILAATEIPLRIAMARKGFQRRSIGPVNYYYHPGTKAQLGEEKDENDNRDDDDSDDDDDDKNIPIVFVHGIGIGLISYQPLIDALLKLGRPIFLPEIPYVSGFRFWQGANCVLPPAVVCSTMTAMLATHGFLRGTFAGHSYGTSWLSYMCKYAPKAVAALLFLDPICFCLHVSRLTKKFVYHRPDPGTISYIIRTDLTVNWTIQRSFPWAWIALFKEQVHVPCSVFLSDQDALVPAQKVEEYLGTKMTPLTNFRPGLSKEHFDRDELTGCIFRGHGHGDWTDYPTHTVPVIADCVQVLCDRAERHATNHTSQSD